MKFLCVYYENETKKVTRVSVCDKDKEFILQKAEEFNARKEPRKIKVYDDDLLFQIGEKYNEMKETMEARSDFDRIRDLVGDMQDGVDEIQRAINRFYEL